MRKTGNGWTRRRVVTNLGRATTLFVCGPSIAGCSDPAGEDDDGASDSTETGDTTGGDGDGDECLPTPDNIQGPFYRPNAPVDDQVSPPMAPGDLLTVSGTVLDESCAPIPFALLDIWQADADGHYDNDGSSPPPADDEFSHRAQVYADADGQYTFHSIVPGRYLNGDEFRPSHIHVKVSAKDFELLTTQLYFEGDPYNDSDAFIEDELIMPVETDADGRRNCVFDFVLIPPQP
ncbi:MAG: dioxygenase [Nannocystaceae bacterium]